MVERAAEFEAKRAERSVRDKLSARRRIGRYANRLALFEEPEFQRLARIAFDRGIALIDLAQAIERPIGTALLNTKKLGLHFGKRPPLADRLTKAQLLELADPSIPLPELRSARRKRETAALRAQRETSNCEVEKGAVRQAARPAPSREPAPCSPARAQPNSDRARIDRANKRRSDAVKRRLLAKAERFIDSGKTVTKATNVHMKLAVRALEAQRAEESRLSCPVEQAKIILQRRYVPVCSMAVYGGDPDLFVVGSRKDLTREQLLEMAERFAA